MLGGGGFVGGRVNKLFDRPSLIIPGAWSQKNNPGSKRSELSHWANCRPGRDMSAGQ